MSIIFYLIFFLASLFSCNNHTKKSPSKINNPSYVQYESILSDNVLIFRPSNKYSQIPLIFIIDSHADTNIVKISFNYFIKKHPSILAISLDVKNNTNEFIEKLDYEINSLIKKYNVSRIIITGFSGGARMAFYYSLNKKINTLVIFGAGVDQSFLQKNLNFPIIMIAGYKDFNFIETYYSPYSKVVENENLISLYHEGKHQWPDSLFINEIFSCVFKKLNNDEIKNFPEFHINILLDEFKKYELLYKLSNTNKHLYKNQLDNMKNNPSFKEEIQQLEQSIYNEISQRQFIMNALDTKPFEWWEKYHNTIVNSMNSENFINQAFWYRINGFIGIILYSKLNNLYNKNEFNNTFKKLVDIYKLFEPDNKEMKYFMALYYYKNNNLYQAKKIINELINENFTNFNRLKKDFSRLNIEK